MMKQQSDASGSRIARRRLTDRVTRVFVKLGGATIILSILAIFVVIVLEVLPLFKDPSAKALPAATAALDGAPLAVGSDEYRELIYAVTSSGVKFYCAADGAPSPWAFRTVGPSPSP
jgi:ABC-type uncharacterized transport system permease subunit